MLDFVWLLTHRSGINSLQISHPGMHGFDVWWGTERSAPTARLNCGCFNESYCMTGHYKETFACNNYWTVDKGDLQNFTEPEPGDDSEFLVNQMQAFVKQAVKNKVPFFVYLPFHTGILCCSVEVQYVYWPAFMYDFSAYPIYCSEPLQIWVQEERVWWEPLRLLRCYHSHGCSGNLFPDREHMYTYLDKATLIYGSQLKAYFFRLAG